jgi:hypothetical protein
MQAYYELKSNKAERRADCFYDKNKRPEAFTGSRRAEVQQLNRRLQSKLN